MIEKSKVLFCLGALFSVAAAVQQLDWPLAKLTVRVVSEKGDPISGAKVQIGFRGERSNQEAYATGETDTRGEFSAEGYSDRRLLSEASKESYYDSSSPSTTFTEVVSGKWQPWNRLEEITLRPIGDPVPMYTKRVQGDIPALDVPCGYDFQKGDWVVPFGAGERSDLIFTAMRDYRDRSNFTMEASVTFSQQLDGFVRMKSPAYGRNSAFRWERFAPEAGYTAPHLIKFVSRDLRTHVDRATTFDLIRSKEFEEGYYFRVRTIEVHGQITSANYGKITGDIRMDPRDTKTCYVSFTFYFNPTSLDRNLEWDTKCNLFQSLDRDQTPRSP